MGALSFAWASLSEMSGQDGSSVLQVALNQTELGIQYMPRLICHHYDCYSDVNAQIVSRYQISNDFDNTFHHTK